VHRRPALHGQLPAAAGAEGANRAPLPLPAALHTFFEALIEPSLQTNWPAAQCEIPPLRPEHGVLPADAAALAMQVASTSQAMTPRRP
jgi:hypothetical protein